MPNSWTPPLELTARAGGYRLTLVGVTYGVGATLQEASNDLLVRLFDLSMGLRRGALRISAFGAGIDRKVWDFLWELGEVIVQGGDPRAYVLGDTVSHSA
jgi:hypothetical protein